MPLAQLLMTQPAGPATSLTRRPSLRSKPKSTSLSTAYKRSMSTQALARRSFEAANIEISVTSPCFELPGSRVGGGSTHTVFPSPSGVLSPDQDRDRYSLDRLGRSLSLTTLGTSASSSGSDPLDSPPYDLDHLPHVNVSIRSSVSSTNARPAMRHFPSLATLRHHRRSQTSSDGEYPYAPTAEYGSQANGDKAHPAKEEVTISKRLRDGVGQLLTTTGEGMKRSKLLKRLKQRAGVKLSRLFSSDSEDAGSDRREESGVGSESHRRVRFSGVELENSDGSGSASGQSDMGESNKDFARGLPEPGIRRRRRRPTMSIDLSTVSTFKHEISTMREPRLFNPYAYRTRSGYYRYNALPTIIGSPSLSMSPPEEYHTPMSGSPILSTSPAEPQQGLMSLVEQCHAIDAEALSTPPFSRGEAPDLDRSETNGSGIDPLDTVSTNSTVRTQHESTPADEELSIFSPSIYRAPQILATRNTPPISPLDIASPIGAGLNFDFGCAPPTSTGMRPISSFEMIERKSSSPSSSASSRRSSSSTGSIRTCSRIKIDGHPSTASFGSMIDILKPESPALPLTTAVEVRPTLLTRSSVDVGLGSHPPHPAGIAPRPSLPNVALASPPTPSRALFSPTLSPPRTFGSPRFAQSFFPPVPTPPSLIANPKSLGDPYPRGIPDTASYNLAGAGCACGGGVVHAGPQIKRRSSTKRKPSLKLADQRDATNVDESIEPLGDVSEAIEIDAVTSSTEVIGCPAGRAEGL